MSDDSTIIGRGREVLLPPQGNPFTKGGSGEEPKDLSPTEIAARFGGTTPAALAGESANEPTDLQPEDIAALFPSSHDERNAIPRAAAEASSPPAVADLSPADIAAMFPAPAETTPPPARIDIAAFNPDATIGQPKTPDISSTTMRADAASLKADAASTEIPTPNMPFTPTEPFAMPDTADSAFTTASTPEAAPAATSAPAEAPSPAVGFKPINPFAPAVAKPEASPAPTPVYGIASPAASDAPDDVSENASRPKTTSGQYPVPPVAEEKDMVEKLITDERVEQLWQRIEAAEKAVVADVNSLPAQRTASLENLKAARNLLLGGRKNFEDSQRYVAEAEADVMYAGRVRRWSYTYGLIVLLYNLLWLGLLVFGYASAERITQLFASTLPESYGFAIWVTLLAGGLGGVSKSLFSLASHVSKQDFDRQHLMWYFTSPLIGTVLGIFVYMFAQMGMAGAGAAIGLETAGLTEKAGFTFYLLAWVVGFQQNLVLELVERVKKVLLPDEKEKEEDRQISDK